MLVWFFYCIKYLCFSFFACPYFLQKMFLNIPQLVCFLTNSKGFRRWKGGATESDSSLIICKIHSWEEETEKYHFYLFFSSMLDEDLACLLYVFLPTSSLPDLCDQYKHCGFFKADTETLLCNALRCRTRA